MAGNRMKKVDSEIQKTLSKIISKLEDKDLANEIISILKVDTFADFSLSKIYVSALGNDEKKKKIVQKLNDNKKTIRYELAHQMRMRIVPDLIFILDDLEEKSSKILKLFEKIESETK